MPFYITKASGERERFSPRKLARSLRRAGAQYGVIKEIVRHISREPKKFGTTAEIYRHAFEFLRKTERPVAARFNLKSAIMQLGPAGFYFEQLVAEILRAQGYSAQTDQIVQGRCVRHEVDVIAEKGDEHYLVECKFHNQKGFNCDVKIPLYISARFWDIEKNWKKINGHENKIHQAWLVTNTRFSDDAINYGLCSGLKLIGWDFPKTNSLKDLIDRNGLHPITSLSTLTKFEKQTLLDNDIVLCSELKNAMALLSKIISSEERVKKIETECHHLCTETSKASSVSV